MPEQVRHITMKQAFLECTDKVAGLRHELEQAHQDHLRIEEGYLSELHEAKQTLAERIAERDAAMYVVEAARHVAQYPSTINLSILSARLNEAFSEPTHA
jgi:hypothetical protein